MGKLPLGILVLVTLGALCAFFGIYFLMGRGGRSIFTKERGRGERDYQEIMSFHFNEKSGFLGWSRHSDVLNASLSPEGLIIKVGGRSRPLLSYDGSVDGGSISAIRVAMSEGSPSVNWHPYESQWKKGRFRAPDLLFRNKRSITTYYFFVEEEPTWRGELSVSLCLGQIRLGSRTETAEFTIRSISFLCLSQEYRRSLEGKKGDRGTAKIRLEVREVIYATPPHCFEEAFFVPKEAVLEFGYGVLHACWARPGDGVTFSVHLKDEKGSIHSLLHKEVNPKKEEKDQRWFDERIPLPDFEGQRVTLIFETDHGEDPLFDYAVWNPPQVFSLLRGEGDINVLLVSLDTLRADHLGCYGYPRNTSPTIDALAKEGVLFSSVFAPSSSTLTSHMSLMTSLLPCSHQVLNDADQLAPEVTTLAEALREKGFFNVAFAESSYVDSKFGFDQGFHRYHDCFRHITQSIEKEMREIKNTFLGAAGWIRENGFKKFFIFLHTYEVHTPYAPPPAFLRKFCKEYAGPLGKVFDTEARKKVMSGEIELSEEDRAYVISLYDAGIRHADHYLNEVLQALRERGILDKTLILLLSDHGEDFFDHFKFADHGNYLYDELIRVPLIMKLPGILPAGKRISGLVSLLDVMPTVMDLCRIPSNEECRGRSLLPLLQGGEPQSQVYSMIKIDTFPMQRFAVRTMRYKYIFTPNCEKIPFRERLLAHPRNARFKNLLSTEELFDLEIDPREWTNIAEENPGLAGRFQKEVEKVMKVFKREHPSREMGVQEDFRKRLEVLGYIE